MSEPLNIWINGKLSNKVNLRRKFCHLWYEWLAFQLIFLIIKINKWNNNWNDYNQDIMASKTKEAEEDIVLRTV
jgi:hypothetical protein